MPVKKTNKINVAPAAPKPAPAPQNLNQTKAIVSLVLGIAGLVLCWVPIIGPVLSIVALVLGIQSKKSAEQQPSVYGGRGLALAGLIIGIVGLVL